MFTIGHSTHPIDEFIALLERHRVNCVCDVRSAPYSRRNPQFNRETLKTSLEARGVSYVFLGRELGARAEDDSCYVDGRVSFERLAATALFRHGIDRLITGNQKFTIALMCAEKEPLDCHRTILVARYLTESDVAVEHILADGKTESHSASIDRLIERVGLGGGDLFATGNDIVEQAYRRQEAVVAYADPARAPAHSKPGAGQ